MMGMVMQEARGQSICNRTPCGQRHESHSEKLWGLAAEMSATGGRGQRTTAAKQVGLSWTAKSDCLLSSLNSIYAQREPAGNVEANKSSNWTETTDAEAGKSICRPVRCSPRQVTIKPARGTKRRGHIRVTVWRES